MTDGRKLAARLLNCQAEEVAFVGPTSLALSFIASGLKFRRSDNILIYFEDYPNPAFFRFRQRRFFDMAEESSSMNGFAWFLAGLGIGALAGVLYAPKSGRETREDLASTARESTQYLRNRGRQVAEQVGSVVDKGREHMGEYVDRGREAVDRGRAQWEDFVERGKNLVGEQSSRVSAAVDAGRQAYRSSSGGGVTSSSASSATGASASGNPAPSTETSGS